MPCDNPVSWDQLVIGVKYDVYPKAGNGDQLIFSAWFCGYGSARGPSTTVVFRKDARDDPNVLDEFQRLVGFGHWHKPDPNGDYDVEIAVNEGGVEEGGERRYCASQEDEEMDPGMAVEDGGRRRRRTKTRASQRTSLARSRSRKRLSQQRRVKSRRQRRM